eukprot:CAMPEP_0198201232 /NCGR_PEP_ID=MMETSP1445-20131203/3979_1 /TAXON_ID=36898 /ORGANISM="Pyramimonas sp., Strain CCMP2087" /LENGTH=830 /DNA_ID=CAMNT_0043871443 /DNA_START=179 /DNA_END=2671 /DNA_ORIENTATION=+
MLIKAGGARLKAEKRKKEAAELEDKRLARRSCRSSQSRALREFQEAAEGSIRSRTFSDETESETETASVLSPLQQALRLRAEEDTATQASTESWTAVPRSKDSYHHVLTRTAAQGKFAMQVVESGKVTFLDEEVEAAELPPRTVYARAMPGVIESQWTRMFDSDSKPIEEHITRLTLAERLKEGKMASSIMSQEAHKHNDPSPESMPDELIVKGSRLVKLNGMMSKINVLIHGEKGKQKTVEEHTLTGNLMAKLVEKLYTCNKKTQERRANYKTWFMFILYMMFYFIVLFSQANPKIFYPIVASTQMALFPDHFPYGDEGVPLPPMSETDVLSWIWQTVETVWTHPQCGDGRCDTPNEFPSYHRFGCQADCGKERDLVAVALLLEYNFVNLPELYTAAGITPEDARTTVKWNLCNFDQDRETYGVPQLCWFEEGQYITKNQGSEFYEMEVKPGTWTIEIEGDHLGILGGSIYSTNKTGGLVEIQPEEEWNTCTEVAERIASLANTGARRRLLSENPASSTPFEIDTAKCSDLVAEPAEFFTGMIPFDIMGLAYSFWPITVADGSLYKVCPIDTEPGTGNLNDPPYGDRSVATELTVLSVNDEDGEWVDIELPGFTFYNVTYTRMYVNPNGFVSFVLDKGFEGSVDIHFRAPRVAALFTDLDPSSNPLGKIASVVVQYLGTPGATERRLVTTWINVAVFGDSSSNSNTFSITLYMNSGGIQINYGEVTVFFPVTVGLSAGTGVPAGWTSATSTTETGSEFDFKEITPPYSRAPTATPTTLAPTLATGSPTTASPTTPSPTTASPTTTICFTARAPPKTIENRFLINYQCRI